MSPTLSPRTALLAPLALVVALSGCGVDDDSGTGGPAPTTPGNTDTVPPDLDRSAEAAMVAERAYIGLYSVTTAVTRELDVIFLPEEQQPEPQGDSWVRYESPPADLVERWIFEPGFDIRHALDGDFLSLEALGRLYEARTPDEWLASLSAEASGVIAVVSQDMGLGQVVLGNGKEDPLSVDVDFPDQGRDSSVLDGPLGVEVDDVELELMLEDVRSSSMEPDLWTAARLFRGNIPFTLRQPGGTMTGSLNLTGGLEMEVRVNGDSDTHVFAYYSDLGFLRDPYGGPTEGPAPPFTLTSLDGDEVSLADAAGSVVLLGFTAHWCRPCEELMTNLDAIGVVYPDTTEVMVFAFDDGQRFARVRERVEPLAVGYPVLEGTPEVAASYGLGIDATVLPLVFVIDASGAIVDRRTGLQTYADLVEAVTGAGGV